MVGINTNVAGSKDSEKRGVLPSGTYPVVVNNSESCVTKYRKGNYLKVSFKVVDGEHKGRQLFHNFNFKNDSEEAVRIGLEQMHSLCTATGVNPVDFDRDTVCVHGKQLLVLVKKEQNEGYDEQNKIVEWQPLGGPGDSGSFQTDRNKEPGDIPF